MERPQLPPERLQRMQEALARGIAQRILAKALEALRLPENGATEA